SSGSRRPYRSSAPRPARSNSSGPGIAPACRLLPRSGGPLLPRSGGELVERDLDQWAEADHRLQVLLVPRGLDDLAEDLAPLLLVRDDAGRPGQVCHGRPGHAPAFQVKCEMRICLEVGDPGTLAWAGHAADVGPAVERMGDDLDSARLAGLAPGGGDVDEVALGEGAADGVVHVFSDSTR